ncbi:MAG TPA: hypothetical protein VGK74_05560 [Symbiobacteriaceae bacterium]|jgi:tetratricopeptide (TPR) repeat protein
MLPVSQLGRLLERGEYKECLKEARALLADGEHGPESTARILAAICRSTLELTDYFAAAEAGFEAVAHATEAKTPDLLGGAFIDLGTALSRIRRYDEALTYFQRYLDGLPQYTGARCLEGIALQRMGETLWRAGRPDGAVTRFRQGRRWFEHYGDERGALECVRALIRIHVDVGELTKTAPLLAECRRYAAAHPGDREFLSNHLLDLAVVHLAAKQHAASAEMAFQALEAADERLLQQSRAHLLLSQNALAQDKPLEALNFCMAARVSAIDGKLYDLEFEASEILFRLLRERGEHLLRELEGEFDKARVDLFHYVSEQAVGRMFHRENT